MMHHGSDVLYSVDYMEVFLSCRAKLQPGAEQILGTPEPGFAVIFL